MKTNYRKMILNKCKELGLEVDCLLNERRPAACLGETWTYSCWMLFLKDGGQFETDEDFVDVSVPAMLERLEWHAEELKEEK